MKLDLTGIVPNTQVPKGHIGTAASVPDQTPGSSASTKVPVDRITFQSGSANVKTLVSSALASPEIRQDKVDSLRQSIGNGTYKFDADKVADAMISSSEQS